ncbi:cryptochrome circadian regulator 3b isoform X1 [Onychostoma macrolepis]|uniref:cryptochrome circadian regulator 3b isoform X1 n=1 Tax=Onychostoma macrolepis TaxID=369639 RepID=UPI002729DB95|nr:cryptochrome circadian regulator 3b isoform X1 [Onychostoma macrolepis]
MPINSIHWFRKGLRLHDNPALLEAARGSQTLRCVYFLDPWFAGASNRGINRWRFLLQCLEDLDSSLRKLNSCLFVIRGQPANIFPRLFKEWKVSRLTFECDSEPFGKERDAAIKKLASEAGVEVITKISHTLYDLDRIMELNSSQPPLTYKRFQTLVSSMEPPEPPLEPLTRELLGNCVTPVSENHKERYGVPLLDELGFDTESLAPAVWPGGESEALMRLERHLGPDSTAAWQENFERPKMNSSPLLASPLGLSPYLRFGCLSCRLFYYKLTELFKKVKNGSPSISLYDKLLWREFFYTAASNNPRFDRMEGNPICIRIPWDRNPEALAKWAEAKTGFPWIDAIMTQLRQEGWIHHLARHAVACFLTRGDLWISWEEGMKVFEELLLDADWSVNAGSWLCHSCSSFFQQFFHCYCPVGFGRRIDPNGDFIRRYLPILQDFPAKYIYDPWNAPEEVQRAAKCVIGVDYPKPMVNHAEASRLNIERMRQIYQQLSRYRGLSLLATVPSNHMEVVSVSEAQGAAVPPTCRRTQSSTSSHPGVRREQPGPSRPKYRGTRHRHALNHRTSPYTTQSNLTENGHEFAVPQQPGRLFWPIGGGAGKRETEAEHNGCHGDDGPSTSSSALKAQVDKKRREDGEGVAFSS